MRGLDLDGHGLSWTHAPDVLAHLLPDGRAAVINRDLDATAASLEAFAPGDGERWRRAYADWRQVAEPMLDAITSPFPPVRGGLGLLRRLRVAGALRLARRLVLPVRKLGDELFDGAGGPVLLAGCALHTDLSPEEAGSGVYGWLLAMLGQQVGWPVPVGGAQRITDALVARLVERGGRISYDARVERVLTARGRAMGVRTAGGTDWRARRAVLADVPAPALYLDLVGAAALPPRLVEDLAHFRWDGSTLKVDWALSAPMPWTNRDLAGAGTVHLGADMDGLTTYSAALARGEVPRDPFLLVGQMTVAEPSHSPPGTESLWSYTHLPFRRHWRAEEVAGHVERMEEVLEDAAPGFRASIVGRHVAGPGRPGGGRAEPGRRRAGRRHRSRVPAAVPAADPRPGPRRHAGGPALPGQRLGPPGWRGARRAGRERRPRRAGPRPCPHRRGVRPYDRRRPPRRLPAPLDPTHPRPAPCAPCAPPRRFREECMTQTLDRHSSGNRRV